MTIYRKVNDVEFDHVFTVMSGGTITDGPSGIYAPSSHDGELDGSGWEYFTHGYTGQYGYRGPIMHASEFIGGRLERDILSTPGIYAVVADYPNTHEFDGPDGPFAECRECGFYPADHPADSADGWAVVRYTGKLPTRGRYIGIWHGGHSYSHGEWTDAEWFGSLADAVEAIRDRRASHMVPATFRYVMRDDARDATPCAHDEWSGSLMLYRITDAVTPDDVEYMIGTGYPDRCIRFGPRGGVKVENC